MTKVQSQTNLTEMFRALGDKTRYKLVKQLRANQGACVSELAQNINISVAGVSQQLKVLESADIITKTRDGQRICYVLNSDNPNVVKILQLL